MHELYSYAGNRFSLENLVRFLRRAKEALEPGGKILIKDPARPSNPEEILQLTLTKDDGCNPSSLEEIDKTPSAQLSTNSLLLKFIREFVPAQRHGLQFYFRESNEHRLPAWLIHEFLAHRGFAKQQADWDSEIHEQYGVFSKEEMVSFARENGWKLDLIEITHDPYHRAASLEGVTITELNGKQIDFQKRFPNNFRAVLVPNEN